MCGMMVLLSGLLSHFVIKQEFQDGCNVILKNTVKLLGTIMSLIGIYFILFLY